MNETTAFLMLALLPDVGPRRAKELAARGLDDVLSRPDDHADLLRPAVLSALRSGEARRAAEDEQRRAHASGVHIIGFSDPRYPGLLRHTYDPPPVPYVKGKPDGDDGPRSVAIVGSRKASPQGLALARRISKELAAAGATIVSGLARGIDAAAHQGAVDAEGRTVAVLGSGLDRLYPRENARLAEALAERGSSPSFPSARERLPGTSHGATGSSPGGEGASWSWRPRRAAAHW